MSITTDDGGTMIRDGLIARYLKWTEALTDWRLDAIRAGVSLPEFRAILPGPHVELTLSSFVADMERRRSGFSDFGRNIEVLTGPVTTDNLVIAHYNMTVTHDGELGWMGGDEKLAPTGKVITFPSVDMVTFDEKGLITRFVVVSDRLSTFLAMNGLSG